MTSYDIKEVKLKFNKFNEFVRGIVTQFEI